MVFLSWLSERRSSFYAKMSLFSSVVLDEERQVIGLAGRKYMEKMFNQRKVVER